MSVRFLKLLFITFFFTISSYAQITIKGIVKDTDKNTIEFANVFLMDQNNKLVTGTTTDKKGAFKLSVEKGNYILKVSFLGYKDWEKDIVLKNDIKAEVIQLIEDRQTLEEIQINASTKIFKRAADRLIFDVKNSLVGRFNGDVTELLNFTPSVTLEGESIQVFGKEGVLILINGRDSKLQGVALMAFLKSFKASDIDSIEIINTPPAKYDAEGNIALINIITKKKNIDFWNSNMTASYRQGYYGLASYSGSFNYNKKKLFFSANLTSTNGKIRGEERSKIFYPNNLWNGQTDYIYKTNLLTANISSEYRINSNWLLGAQYIGSFNTPSSTNQDNIIVQKPSLQKSNTQINNIGKEGGKKDFNSLNFHTVVNITPKRVINIDFDHFNYKREQESIITSSSDQINNNNFPDI
ncbi:MAG: carboxypeptidase-like regulatory domain-containing protein, partial [Polaribacter sp.]